MFVPATSEQVSQSNVQRTPQLGGDGMQRALTGTPVQMLLMLQRTAGNQAVNQLLRQYKSSRQPAPGLVMPAVQRCGGKPCNCSPQEKAAHTQVQAMEDEQAVSASADAPASVQRDADDEDDGGAADSASESAAEPAQGANEGASASADTDDASPANADEPAQEATDDAAASGDSDGDGGQSADPADSDDDAAADDVDLSPIPAIEGEGETHEDDVFGGSSKVQGKTHADFTSTFSMPTIIPTKGDASSCGCAAKDCIHVSGTMTSTFTMNTQVTLPTPPDGLTDHQKEIFQGLIDSCLSPHEQQHVAAFNAYQGSVQTPFDLTCCRADLHSSLQAIHDGVEQPRHAAAQSASDALDPFNATFDSSCADDASASACTTCPPTKA